MSPQTIANGSEVAYLFNSLRAAMLLWAGGILPQNWAYSAGRKSTAIASYWPAN